MYNTLRGAFEGGYNCSPNALADYRLGHGGGNTTTTMNDTDNANHRKGSAA